MSQPDPGQVTIDTLMFGSRENTAVQLLRAERPALIDAGSASTAGAVLATLQRLEADSIEAILLTHIHVDHAGGTGELIRAFPEATVYAPARVVRHLVDPTALIAGVRTVWGDRTESLFGLPSPVPADRITPLDDGDRIDLGDRSVRAIATPGHTRAHLAYFDEVGDAIHCGDALGVNLPSVPVNRPATPPADFSFSDAFESIERIRQVGAGSIFVSHYGQLPESAEQTCDRAAAALERWRGLFERERPEAAGPEDLCRRVQCALEAGVEPLLPAQRRRLETVNPAWLNVGGMTAAAERSSLAS